jgi:hypothetical protein
MFEVNLGTTTCSSELRSFIMPANCIKPGIDCARQTRSFVYALITVLEARQPRAAVDRRCSSGTRPSQLKEHSTLKSLCRGTKNRSDLARHAPGSRAAAARNRYPA